MRYMAVAAWLCGFVAAGQTAVFLEPVEKVETNRAEVEGRSHRFRRVDGTKYLTWLENEAGRRALWLYRTAFGILGGRAAAQGQSPEYWIALAPGGNHAAVGLTVEGEGDKPRLAYILLDAAESRFETTLLHETAHVAMAMLAGGKQLPRADISSIPHTTAALSDRGTAFSEGYAIHFETLMAQRATDPKIRGRYQHESPVFGEGPWRTLEFFRPSSDLATYAQSQARFIEVRENHFAFEPAFKGADYLRAQVEKARDFASLRDANALLESEGFYASFFYAWAMRGVKAPDDSVLESREQRVLRAMMAMFDRVEAKEDTPWLLEFVQECGRMFPEEKPELHAVLHDLSRGVFADPDARRMWRDHYLAALRLDLKGLGVEQLQALGKRWIEQSMADDKVLFRMVRPTVRCEVKEVAVKVEAFGEASPLLMNVNTAPEGVLRLVPGLTDGQLRRWLDARPFANWAEFQTAVGETACRP